MRVNPNFTPDVLAGIQQSQQALDTALQQLSSGRRVSKPSDDPTAAAAMSQSLSESANVDQYTTTIQSALGSAQMADSSLSSVVSLLTQAIALGTQGANGTQITANRDQLATQAESLLASVVAQANTTYQGHALFSGTAGDPQSVFVADANAAPGFDYYGDSGVNTVQIGASLSVVTNVSGDQIFTSATGNVLGSLQELITQLRSGSASGIAGATAQISAAIDHVGQVRATYANSVNQMNAQETFLAQEKVTLTSQQNNLVGVDTAQAAVTLSQAEVTHNAVLAAAAKILPESLLNYLK